MTPLHWIFFLFWHHICQKYWSFKRNGAFVLNFIVHRCVGWRDVREVQEEDDIFIHGALQVVLVVKNPPANTGRWFWSLGQEDPLEGVMATHSSILAWRNPRIEEPGRLLSMGSQRVRHDWSDLACRHMADSLCWAAKTKITL